MDLKENNKKSPIVNSYIANMKEEYLQNNSLNRIVIDYIAGMTDDYFVKEYKRITKESI